MGPMIDAIYRRLMDRDFASHRSRRGSHFAGRLNKHLRA